MGKKIVGIGGASGIGFAVAEMALAPGAEVVVGSSQAARIEAAADKLGKGATGSPSISSRQKNAQTTSQLQDTMQSDGIPFLLEMAYGGPSATTRAISAVADWPQLRKTSNFIKIDSQSDSI